MLVVIVCVYGRSACREAFHVCTPPAGSGRAGVLCRVQARLRALAFLSVSRLVLSWGLALRMTEPNTPNPFDHLRTLFSPGSTHTRDGPRVAPSVVQPQEDMSANQVSAQLRAAGELDTTTDVSNSPNQPAPHTLVGVAVGPRTARST